MIETSGIDHIVLHVADPQKSKKFYTEILGMTVYRDSDRQVFMHAGHQGVALFKKDGGAAPAGGGPQHPAGNVAGGAPQSLTAPVADHRTPLSRRPRGDPCNSFFCT